MNLRTLLGWSLAATLLAACSGGAGSVSPSTGSSNNTPAQGVQLVFNMPFNPSATSLGRTAQFIGTGVTSLGYSFTGPASVSNSFPYVPGVGGNSGTFTGCTGGGSLVFPATYTCVVPLPPGNNYSLALALVESGITIGTGASAATFNVASGPPATPVGITINPINSNVKLGVAAGSQTEFYNDGSSTVQTVTLQANEVDPAGDIITGYYGPTVAPYVYPTLTFTPGGSTAGILPAPPGPLNALPGAGLQNGNQVAITYGDTPANNAANTTSLTYTITDNDATPHTSPVVSIPFVTLSNNSNNPAPGQLTLTSTGVGGEAIVTATEQTTAPSGGLDPSLTSTTTCSPDATITASSATTAVPGTNQLTGAGPAASVTYTVVANDAAVATCTLTLTSSTLDAAHMKNIITINFPGSASVGVSSRGRN
jgi:hypothetical protein